MDQADLLLPILTKMLEAIERMEAHEKGQFALLQQQMSVLERQVDAITILASRSFTSNLDPVAKAAALEDSKKLAGQLMSDLKAEEDAILSARMARGIGNGGDAVTDEDIEDWRRNGGQ